MSAIIAAGVASVAAAGISAYSAHQQGKAAEKQQKSQADNAKALYGSKVKPPEVDEFDPTSGARDLYASLPFLNQAATYTTKSNQKNREMVAGGNFKSNLAQQGANIADMLKGKVPQDVIDSITRSTAEKVGGGAVGAGSMGANEFSRNLGLTSVDLMNKGMSFAPIWEQLVDQFTSKTEDAAGQAMQMLMARNQRDAMKYSADMSIAKNDASPDPQAVGQFKDSQELEAIRMQAKTNQLNAMVGLINSGSSLYGSFNTGGTNSLGKYKTSSSVSNPSDWRTSARGAYS